MNTKVERKTSFEEYKDEVRKKIYARKKQIVGKKIVLFGIVEISNYVLDILNEMGINLYMVVDNSPKWSSCKWRGVEVYPVERLIEEQGYIVFCCTPVTYDKKIQLLELGVNRRDIIFICPKKVNMINRMRRLGIAWDTYTRIRNAYGKNLLLCPYPGTGDAFLTGRYLEGYIEKLGWTNYTILVTGGAFRKVLKLYGYENCEVIDRAECEDLELLLSYYGQTKLNVYFMLYWGMIIQNAWRLEEIENGVTFHELFRETVFGTSSTKVNYPQFSTDYNFARRIMNELGLTEGHTIILLPYANSFVEELLPEWWEKLSNKLQDNGYTVATNCGSKNELEVVGTIRLDLSYELFAPVAELCGYMVGVRSGVFDLMSGIKCKKIVIYQDFISYRRKNFFSLNAMELCTDAIEFKLDLSKGGEKKIEEDILRAVQI